MTKLLLIQSRKTPERIEREQENFRRALQGAAELECLSALDERLAWTSPDEFLKGADGVIFGGSSDFDFHGGRQKGDPARILSMIILSRSKMLVTYAFAQQIPILGVCFGHQIIANMRGGEVENDLEQTKRGAYSVELTAEGAADPLFSKLPKQFSAQYEHKDSATQLPEDAVLLAQGERCRFAALRYGPRAYTVQFHPEILQIEGAETASDEAYRLVPLWVEEIVNKRG